MKSQPAASSALDLGLDEGDEIRDQAVLRGVGPAAAERDEQRQWPGNGHAHRPIGAGAGKAELFHDAEPARAPSTRSTTSYGQ